MLSIANIRYRSIIATETRSLKERVVRSELYAFPRLVPLAMILERYGLLSDLKAIGSQLFGVCPLHQGSNKKQFVVDLNKGGGVWHCFGDCNRGGGALDFVAAREGIEIKEAAKLVREWFALAPLSNVQPKRRRRVMSEGVRPTHKCFVVDGEGENAFWNRVGSAWPHKNGRGLNVVIPPGISVSGRLVLLEYTPDDEEQDKKAKKPKR